MAGPWEKYQQAQQAGQKPWEKYAALRAERTPDGRSVAPNTSREDAARIPEGMVYDERTGGYVDANLEARRMGPAFGARATLGSSVPFIGQGFDETVGAMRSAVTGESPEIGQEVVRQSRDLYREQFPVTSTAVDLTGAIASSAPFGAPAARLVNAARGPALKTAAALGLGAAVGGAEGAARGYLAGEGDRRGRNAARTGVVAAGIGGAAGPAGLAMGAIGKNLAARIKRTDLQVIADEFGVDRRTAALLRRYLVNDDLDKAQKLLARGGDDAMLADAGMGTATALDSAAQTGGAPLRIAREAVDQRANAAQGRIVTRLDGLLGAPEGKRAATAAIRNRTAKARQAAYDAAYSKPINYDGAAGQKVRAVLERVSPRTMQKAIDEANDAMRDEVGRSMRIVADIGEDGVAFSEPLSVQQLDYLKRALDDIARKGTDPLTGQMDDAARRASSQAKALRDAVKEAVPEYRRALRLGGDTIAERDALAMGGRLLDPSLTVEDVRDAMKGATEAQKAAIRQGLRQSIDKRMGDVRATLTDNATEAREAVKATLDVSSRNAKEKIRIALGDKADDFFKTIDEASAALELRAAMAANSKTAIRTAGREAVDEVTAPNAVESLATFQPGRAAQQVTSALTGMTDLPAERREAVLTQVAEALTRIRGRKAQQALRTVRKALDGEPVNEAMARQVGSVVGGQSFIAAYQGLTRLQER